MERRSDRSIHHIEGRFGQVSDHANAGQVRQLFWWDSSVPILLICVFLAVACTSPSTRDRTGSPDNSKSSPARGPLRPVNLPDLSRASPTVQKQLSEAYGAMTAVLQNITTNDAEWGAAYGEMGKFFMAAEFLEDAEPCFLNAHQLSPREIRWPYFLAHVYRLEGRSSDAVVFFERALQIRPHEAAALIWLGDLYLDQDRPAEAEALFQKALAIQPRLVAARFGMGRAALAKRDYPGAVQHLEAALALDRRASIIHYPLALAYRHLGRVEEAERHERQKGEVEINPPDPLMQEIAEGLQSPVAYESRGDRAITRGEFAAAAAEFRKGLELAPERLSLRQKLATAVALTGHAEGGVRQFQEVLQRSPEFAEAHYSLGVLLLSTGHDDLATERFAAAVRYDPSHLEARLQLANTLRRRGRAEASLRQYAEVLKLDPRVAEGRFGYALALVRLKRYQ